MPDKSLEFERQWAYAGIVIENGEKIAAATNLITRQGLLSDEIYLDVLSFYLAQIGEQFAPAKLSSNLTTQFGIDNAERRQIYSQRNLIDHDYSSKIPKRILKTVQDDIPPLLAKMKRLQAFCLEKIMELNH